MTQQEAFNTIKKVVDLALQNGVIKSIEESKVVFDSVETIFKGIQENEKNKELAKKTDNDKVDNSVDNSLHK
jgi:hypothetical protein